MKDERIFKQYKMDQRGKNPGQAKKNPAEGGGCSSLVFVVCCVGSGLCDELITRLEESYRLCVSNCV